MIRSLRVRLAIVALGILVLVLAPMAFLLRGAVHINYEYNITTPGDEAAKFSAADAMIASRLHAIGHAVANTDVHDYDASIEALLEDISRQSNCILWLEATDGTRDYFAPQRTPELTVRRIGERGIEVSWVGVDGTRRDESLLTTLHRYEVPVADGATTPARRWWLGVAPLPPFVDVAQRATGAKLIESTNARVVDALITRYFWAIGVLLVAVMTPTLFRLLRPVRELTAAVERFAAGDRSARVAVRGKDELATLGVAFNAMGDRIEKEEALRNAMVADVAHELRTPLTNLRGQLEAIQDGLAGADAKSIASLRDETLLLARIVDDLQLLALADAGELPVVLAPVDVAVLVERAIVASRAQFDARRVTLATAIEPALPPLHGDADRLGQVLRNLLSNAARHAPPGSEVTLTARRTGDALELSVADRGPGISAELLPRLFQRFARCDASRTRATGGAGLGLSVVKTLVEAHGGGVHAENRPDDGGARFVVVLPLARESISR